MAILINANDCEMFIPDRKNPAVKIIVNPHNAARLVNPHAVRQIETDRVEDYAWEIHLGMLKVQETPKPKTVPADKAFNSVSDIVEQKEEAKVEQKPIVAETIAAAAEKPVEIGTQKSFSTPAAKVNFAPLAIPEESRKKASLPKPVEEDDTPTVKVRLRRRK